MIVPPASAVETPSAVTSPGDTRDSSITGMSVIPAVPSARRSGGGVPAIFRSSWRLNPSRASWSIPKVRNSLRKMP